MRKNNAVNVLEKIQILYVKCEKFENGEARLVVKEINRSFLQGELVEQQFRNRERINEIRDIGPINIHRIPGVNDEAMNVIYIEPVTVGLKPVESRKAKSLAKEVELLRSVQLKNLKFYSKQDLQKKIKLSLLLEKKFRHLARKLKSENKLILSISAFQKAEKLKLCSKRLHAYPRTHSAS